MNTIELIKGRRSVRKYKDETLSNEVINEIVDLARFAPSWGNTQITRYNFITDLDLINKISTEGVRGFVYNQKTLQNAKNVIVLSYVEGKSGVLKDKSISGSDRSNEWETFDVGIACQTFCLAAYEKNVGTCIFGVIEEGYIKNLLNLPENEKVAAVITLGYIESSQEPTDRLEVKDITRYFN